MPGKRADGNGAGQLKDVEPVAKKSKFLKSASLHQQNQDKTENRTIFEDNTERSGLEDNKLVYCIPTIIQYLSLKERKNLRLVSWNLYWKVTSKDEAFKTWHILLQKTEEGRLAPLPAFVFGSETALSLTIPAIEDNADYEEDLKDMLEREELQPALMENNQVKHRLVGLGVDLADVEKLKKYFHIPALKIIMLKNDSNHQDYTGVPLLLSEADSLEILSLENIKLIKERQMLLLSYESGVNYIHILEQEEVDDVNIKIQDKLSKLKKISFVRCTGRSLLASVLHQSPNLQQLDVKGNDLTYLQAVEQPINNLHTLNIDSDTGGWESGDTIGHDGLINILHKSKNLKDLNLTCVDLPSSGFKGPELKKIKKLGIFGCTCTDNLIHTLLTNMSTTIESLTFVNSHFEFVPDPNIIVTFDNLMEVSQCMGSSYLAASIIDTAPNLQKIDLYCDMVRYTIDELRECQLKSIKLNAGCLAEMFGCVELLDDHAQTLEHLKLRLVHIFDDVEDLNMLKNIKSLHLDGCSGRLDLLLQKCISLQELTIIKHRRTDRELQVKSENFVLPALKILDLKDAAGLSDEAKQILKAKLHN